jgi:hypothetical protein
MWRLRECQLNDEQLAYALGLSANAIRTRRVKPELWKLSDIKLLASHFGIPTTASVQLFNSLLELPVYLKGLPDVERRQIEQLLKFKKRQLEALNHGGWPASHLLRMHRALQDGVLPTIGASKD